MEGYQATGESATASFLGETEASSFKKACKNVISEHPDLIEYYDNKDNTVWAVDSLIMNTTLEKLLDNRKNYMY